MTTGELISDGVGVLTMLAIVTGFAGWLFRRLNKSRQREIDERIAAADERGLAMVFTGVRVFRH